MPLRLLLFLYAAQAQNADPYAPSPYAFAGRWASSFGFFKWWDETAISGYIKGTTWIFPLVETIHILALAVLLGSVFLIDLRLLSIAIRRWTPAQIMEQVRSMMNWSVGIILVSGVLLFVAEPRKLYDNAAFFPKMTLLALAIIFQYAFYPRVSFIESRIPFWGRLFAFASFGLWFCVAVCGRAIGFV